ncbi:MAG: hypothetical protein R2799_03115 [Crocinitomicaceae bacterium]
MDRLQLIGLSLLSLYVALLTYYLMPSLFELGFDGAATVAFVRIFVHLTWSGLALSAIISYFLIRKVQNRNNANEMNEDLLDS